MNRCTGLFATISTFALAAAATAGAPVQVFGGATETGLRFNPGPTVIVYNNCFINLQPGATQLALGDVVLGFRRLANAPAIDVELFATQMTFDDALDEFNIGTEVSLGVKNLAANGAAAITELLTYDGTGVTLDLELVSNPGLGGFWIGFRTLGPNAADQSEGFRVVTAPAIGASINGFGLFNNGGSGIFEAFFNFNPPNQANNRFFVNVFGEQDGFPCTGPAGTAIEGELCGEDANGGCNMEFPIFDAIASGDVVEGTYWADADVRDTDWYEFTTGDFTNISADLFSEGPGLVLLADVACPANVLAVGGFGCPSNLSVECLPAGTYRLIVLMSVFTGFPCETGAVNNYTLALNIEDAVCEPVCGAGGDCCVAVETPGCSDQSCCETVCAFDPFCCVVAWDQTCTEGAATFCGLKCPTTCDVATNDCCVASGDATPGCNDPECCTAICKADPFCCDTEWDQLCADAAVAGCASCALEPCPITCAGVSEGEDCGVENNDGCNMDFPAFGVINCGETICGTGWADTDIRDTDWYVLTLDEETEVTLSVETTLGLVIGFVDTIDCATATAVNPFAVADNCGAATLTTTRAAGEHWVFVGSTTFNGFPCGGGFNDYALTLTGKCAGGCVKSPDQNGDGCVDGADIAFVLGNWALAGPGLGEGDTNCDDKVDGADIAEILGNWNPCP